MAGVNKVILVGNLGKDPEVRHLESGSVVANFSIATTESYKDRTGNRVEQTEWHDIELWDGLAKIAEQYLKKGRTVYVEGKIKTDTWQDEQGQNRKKVKIRGINMTLLGGKPEGSGAAPTMNEGNTAYTTPEYGGDFAPTPEDDLPF